MKGVLGTCSDRLGFSEGPLSTVPLYASSGCILVSACLCMKMSRLVSSCSAKAGLLHTPRTPQMPACPATLFLGFLWSPRWGQYSKNRVAKFSGFSSSCLSPLDLCPATPLFWGHNSVPEPEAAGLDQHAQPAPYHGRAVVVVLVAWLPGLEAAPAEPMATSGAGHAMKDSSWSLDICLWVRVARVPRG